MEDGILRPTIHCHSLAVLKTIQDEYGMNTALEIYKFLYYMCSHNAKKNPFFDKEEHDKEAAILTQLNCENWTTEDDPVQDALALCRNLFSTPTSRSYMGFKTMLDNLSEYMLNSQITSGRDGNITSLINAGAKFDSLRQSFKGVFKDLMEEQQATARGGQSMAYDQK